MEYSAKENIFIEVMRGGRSSKGCELVSNSVFFGKLRVIGLLRVISKSHNAKVVLEIILGAFLGA